jgi:hypothetical protein
MVVLLLAVPPAPLVALAVCVLPVALELFETAAVIVAAAIDALVTVTALVAVAATVLLAVLAFVTALVLALLVELDDEVLDVSVSVGSVW